MFRTGTGEIHTGKDESLTSDINLSSLKHSEGNTPPVNGIKSNNSERKKSSLISHQNSASKTGREESDDITLTIVSNSQQLSSQMNLRPSIQFMNQDTTEEYQMSDNGGSPFISKMKEFMGESLQHPIDSSKIKTGKNHKFSHSEDLTNVFNEMGSGKGMKRDLDQEMEMIRDIEDHDEEKTSKLMNMEFFRTLGEEENEEKAEYLPSSEFGNKLQQINKDGWGSEDDFVDKSKFLNSQNLRSSRQML